MPPPIEAYVLIAAAYLHDTGMVVSDDEKGRVEAVEPTPLKRLQYGVLG